MSGEEKKYKILVVHPEIPQEALQILKFGCDVIMCNAIPPQRSEILTKSKGVDGIFWACHEKLNGEVLDAAGPNLKSISTMSAGLDYVDVPELKRRGIRLGFTPMVLNDAVADIAIGLMIAAARRFHEGRKKIESSTWENWHIDWMLGQDIKGSTIGFAGFGGIGKAIADRLKGFSVGKIIYYTRKIDPDESNYKAKHVSFDELLTKSDIVFIACPLTEETKEMFNEDAFNKMKSNSILINIARGQMVDQRALYNALKNNKIFAAGLDVMTPEPLPSDDPLLSLPNCVLVPHLGSATRQTRIDMAVIAAHNVVRGIVGEPMFSPAY